MKKTVLIVDDDLDFLETRVEVLEAEGYEVYSADSYEEAERILNSSFIHVAIIDIRLRTEDDDKDVSGLTLVKEEAYRLIPKIILTKYPHYEHVREALGPALDGLPPAVSFVTKQEGSQAMVDAVKKVFDSIIRINWNLVIHPNERNPVSFPHLVKLIEPETEGEQLLSRAQEIEDLFRRLFYSQSGIRIERLLWQREGRVALILSVFSEEKVPESLIMVLGRNAVVSDEARHYHQFAPKAPGHAATVLIQSGETRRFAANVYALADADLENIVSLAELYRTGPEKSFNSALNNLFAKRLAEWHQNKCDLKKNRTVAEMYRQQVGLTGQHFTQKKFEEHVQFILRQAPIINARIEQASGKLQIRFDEQAFSYPDPVWFLNQTDDIGIPALWMNVPGTLSCDNTFTDESGQTWLTDFADAGPAPRLWNFVSLEAAIRFDLIDRFQLQWLHDAEQCLVADEFSNFYTGDIEPALRKPLRAIQTIRRLASPMLGKDARSYHLGVFFHAAARLAAFNSSSQVKANELTRQAHLLVAAAMICSKFTRDGRDPDLPLSQAAPVIRIDKAEHAIWVQGNRLRISNQSYNLLCYLYDHANRLCTRRELVEQALHERQYDETDASQIARLNTAIHRLRNKIGDDPERPRYLLTEQGEGYRLILQREEQG